MRTHSTPLWALCLLILVGCDSLLDDLSGTLCNPDGSCPEGYHCAAETNRCERGPGPSPTPDGGGSDGGTQDGGTDAGVCSGVQRCANADGCCPAGCDANTDNDCQPVCGNGQTEASGNEVCDDGNRLNGDNCDPTCRYFNVMTTLSGVPGSRSFADGQRDVARFHGPAGITADNERATSGSIFYITDSNNSTVRQHRLGITSTLAGRSFFKQSVDGVGSDAGFVAPSDVAYVGGVLYIVDAPNTPGARLRQLDLDGGVVSTVDAGSAFAGLRGIGADRNTLLLVGDNGLQRFDPRANPPLTQLVSSNRLLSTAGDTCFDVAAHPVNTDLYFLACNRAIVQATPSDGGLSVAAGSPTSTGCSSGSASLPTNWRFTRARNIDFGSNANDHRVYVTDSACHTVVEFVFDLISVVAGAPNEPGHVNASSPRLARFNGPTAVAALEVSGQAPVLHVADFDNAAYRTVSTTGTATAAGSPPNTTLAYGDGGTTSRYTSVSALAVDGAAGLLYAYSPSNRRLFQVSLTSGASEELMAFTANPLPLGLTVIRGALYVSLNNKTIARFVRSPAPALQHFAGQANSTAPSADGDVSSAILFASDMTTDGTDLFFHDLSAKTVRKIGLDASPQLVTTIAGGASSDGGPQSIIDGVGPSARFANPVDLTSDGTSLYLLDGPFPNTPRTVVRKVDPASRAVTTLAGEFSSQNAARDGRGLDARFAGAVRLTTDGRVLFISDPGGGYGLPDPTSPAIRMLDLSTLEVSTMVGTRGQWTLKNGTGTGAAINSPGPIVFDPERNSIYFFDFEEGVFQRIR
jgi:cysteine-rich repeat protein